MSPGKVLSWAAAAALLAGTIFADASWAAPGRGRRVYSYQPRATASAPSRVQSYRRYSFVPGSVGGAYATSTRGAALGLRSTYRPGPAYTPRQGINKANWKVQGL